MGLNIYVNSITTYKMYMMTPSDQISQDLSYFSGPSTSGAGKRFSRKYFGAKNGQIYNTTHRQKAALVFYLPT